MFSYIIPLYALIFSFRPRLDSPELYNYFRYKRDRTSSSSILRRSLIILTSLPAWKLTISTNSVIILDFSGLSIFYFSFKGSSCCWNFSKAIIAESGTFFLIYSRIMVDSSSNIAFGDFSLDLLYYYCWIRFISSFVLH